MMNIRLISTTSPAYEQMRQLRLDVLLNPIGVPASYINPEKESADWLVAAFDDAGTMQGCCVLTALPDAVLQLRQMAVRQDVQARGIGRAIIAFAEDLAIEKGFSTLMMHARDVVIPFYEKCGYAIADEGFTEVGIPHHRMEKRLK